ncbi:MAG TPA: TraB/GumN family protein [Chlamydiales bacterium]|jgi:uncharacterized protein YbaP (TraB family)|nr:TraB/GumN family protein [Chlamydiales bacterium]
MPLSYKITNSNGVTSYLIGTYHKVDAESVEKSNFRQILACCSAVYCEAGTNRFVSSAQGSMPEGTHEYKHIPMRYVFDTAIVIEAWCRKIPVFSLDQEIPQVNLQLQQQLRQMRKLGPNAFEKSIMHQMDVFGKNPNEQANFKAWKDGNVTYLAMLREKVLSDEVRTRENAWMKILIPRLLEMQEGICIAVGVAHIVGPDNIAKRLKQAGLQVERIDDGLQSRL